MQKRLSSKEMGLYFILAVIVILVFLLIGGRRWLAGSVHRQDNSENSQTEMESNQE